MGKKVKEYNNNPKKLEGTKQEYKMLKVRIKMSRKSIRKRKTEIKIMQMKKIRIQKYHFLV